LPQSQIEVDSMENEFMDEQGTLNNTEKPKKKRRFGAAFLNTLSAFLAIGSMGILGFSLIVFFNPYSTINPFPPPTPIALIPTQTPVPTSTNTPTALPTETFTPIPSPTITTRPSATLPPSPTPFTLISPTPTIEITRPTQGYPFILQEAGPIAIANISHPNLGCRWMGVAGQVFDLSGGPVTGLLIRLGGRIPGLDIPEEMLSLTGAALNYGRVGYYEFTLADEPIESSQLVWVQLVDQENIPLSEKIYFDTYESCDKNLIIINFKQIR
jgi:hypothetical protein